MRKNNGSHILVWLLLLYSIGGYTQSDRHIHIGLGLTGNTYVGDFSEQNLSLQRFSPGVQFSARFDQGKRTWTQINIGTSRIIEQLDKGNLLSSSSDISPNKFVDASLFNAEFQLNVRLLRHSFIQPYVAAGLGFLFYEPKDEFGNALGDNPFTREPEEVYSTISLYLPLTAGFLVKLGSKLSLGASYTFKPTTTDYIDNIGLLGTRSGNDQLHRLQVTVYYDLKRSQKPSNKPYKPLPEIQPLIVADREGSSKHKEQLAQMAPNWIAWEETALLIRKFVYYTVQEGEGLEDICKQFHVRPSVIKRINFMANDYIHKGMVLRLPDVGQELEAN